MSGAKKVEREDTEASESTSLNDGESTAKK